MDPSRRIETALEHALASAGSAPPRLQSALRYAVFPGGARIRPRLTLAVAGACGDDKPALTDAAAVAVELLHCASLVHDDLPCFDDADQRRGKPTVHRLYGEELAVLVGDGLIVAAFDHLAREAVRCPERLPALIGAVSRGVGAAHGIIAGQAWESEPAVDVAEYHRAKTGALFEAACAAGAIAAGHDAEPWRRLGLLLGEAYQVADDVADAVASAEALGKPVQQDLTCDRPSAVRTFGVHGAVLKLRRLIREAEESVPVCAGRDHVLELITKAAERLVPREDLVRAAASW